MRNRILLGCSRPEEELLCVVGCCGVVPSLEALAGFLAVGALSAVSGGNVTGNFRWCTFLYDYKYFGFYSSGYSDIEPIVPE